MDVTNDWFWEGNVVDAVERHLLETGWNIDGRADTLSKERGVDLAASQAGKRVLIEVKGYPSKQYRDPRRASEVKPTNPANQAQQWFSHALLKAMRLQTSDPSAAVALAFPDFPRYRALFNQTRSGFEKLRLAMIFVLEDGSVESWGL
jgi:hypothetical protein